MAVDTNMHIKVQANQTLAQDLGTAAISHLIESSLTWPNGTAAGQADLVFSDQRTLSASATENLDLAGVLAGAFGSLITMARLKGIVIRAATTNTNDVQVTRPASNGVPFFIAAGDGVAIRPGGIYLQMAPDAVGYPVTAATADLVTVTNSAGGTSVTYDVILLGASV